MSFHLILSSSVLMGTGDYTCCQEESDRWAPRYPTVTPVVVAHDGASFRVVGDRVKLVATTE